jgi:hypothetical protein
MASAAVLSATNVISFVFAKSALKGENHRRGFIFIALMQQSSTILRQLKIKRSQRGRSPEL